MRRIAGLLLLTLLSLAADERALLERAKQSPGDFAANHELAEYYASLGRLKAAIPWFEKARTIDPSNYVNGYDLALAYAETGATENARRQIEKMLGRQDRSELHNLLGLVEEKAGRPEAAAGEYQKAAQMDSTEKNVFDLGQCFLRYRGFEQALGVFSWGVDKYPKSARMQVGLGVAHYSRGQYDQAVEALCRGVDLDPTDTRAIYFLGQMFDISPALAGEVTRRLAHFIEVYPKNAAANYYYALSLWKRTSGSENRQTVETYLKKAVALDPKMADAHLQLGILYEDAKQMPEAIREYESAAKLDPENEKTHFRLARAYRAAGRDEQAQEQFRLYRQLHSKQ